MQGRVLDFIKRPNSLNVIINTVGNYLNVGFTALFAIILFRMMEPAQYGVLSVLLAIAYVLATVLDFGTTAAIYSNLPVLLEAKSTRIYQFIKTTFVYQSVFSGIVISLLLITFPYLDRIFFKTGAASWELYVTAFSILFLLWQNFALNILFAAKKFLSANIYNNLQNIVKTAVLFILVNSNHLSVGGVLFVFGIFGPIVFFALLLFHKKDFILILAKASVKKEEFKFGYTLTYFIATQLFNLGGRMDLFLLSFYGLRNDVGYYGLSQKIILSVVTTVVSITQVLSPNFSRINNRREAFQELKHAALYLLLPSGLFVLLFFTPKELFYILFTEKKVGPVIPITRSLIPAYIIFTLGNIPLQFILYSVKKPIYVLYGNIVFFFAMIIGCYTLIPRYGVLAPPWVNLVAMSIPVTVLSIATYYEYKKLPTG